MFGYRIAATIAVGLFVLGAGNALAQAPYPSKVIRIVTAAPGSNNDWGARLVGDTISPTLGQRVIVENRGGLAVDVVAKSPPDGYTILFYGPAAWTQHLFRETTVDPLRDLAPITMAMISPIVLVVHPSLPVRSVKELIALAKARPGELNYASGTVGATPFLAGELFKYMAKVNIVRVAYKGTGPSMIGVMSGEVACSCFPARARYGATSSRGGCARSGSRQRSPRRSRRGCSRSRSRCRATNRLRTSRSSRRRRRRSRSSTGSTRKS